MIARAQQWLMDGLFVLICLAYYAAVIALLYAGISLYEASKARAQSPFLHGQFSKSLTNQIHRMPQ